MRPSWKFVGSVSVSIAILAAAHAAEPPKDVGSSAKENRAPVSESAAKDFFKRLAGQWEGQIQTSRDGNVSASVVTVSNRTEDKGLGMASCFEGFSFGQVISGALVCKYNSEKGQIDNAWFDSERDATIRSSVKDGDVSSSLTFAGSFSDAKTGKSTSFQFVFKTDGADKYSIEYFFVADNGAKTSVLTMDLERMQEGKKCAAADRFEDAAFMSRVRGSQRANVDDSK